MHATTDQELTLTLPAGVVGLCLAGLADMPYKISGQAIQLIQSQVAAQLAKKSEAPASTDGS